MGSHLVSFFFYIYRLLFALTMLLFFLYIYVVIYTYLASYKIMLFLIKDCIYSTARTPFLAILRQVLSMQFSLALGLLCSLPSF